MEIRNGTKDKTTTKAQVQNNKDDSYNISYFAKETGKCNVLLKLNVQTSMTVHLQFKVEPDTSDLSYRLVNEARLLECSVSHGKWQLMNVTKM